jgi:cell wall-active antibiotic response 4TMS protein YvqF
MFFTPNLVIGLTVMSVGVVLLLDTLGIRDAGSMLRYWPALIVLFGASIMAQAFKPVDPSAPAGARRGGGVPCFFLFLLGVALFASNGFPGAETRAAGRAVATATGILHTASTKGGSDIRTGRVAAVMGKSSLDLRQVTLAPGEVMTVDVFVTMGNATIRIPDEWVVDASALPVMGAIEEDRFPRPVAAERGTTPPGFGQETHDRRDARLERDGQGDTNAAPPPPPSGPAPRLRLRGFVMMGKVEVTS